MSVRRMSKSDIRNTQSTNVMSGNIPVGSPVATGGDFVSGVVSGYKYHAFIGNGTFTVTEPGLVELLIVAGGGGGGRDRASTLSGAGGGAGGVLNLTNIYVPVGGISVTIGGGGVAGTGADNAGSSAGQGTDSIFASFVAVGGGAGPGSFGDDRVGPWKGGSWGGIAGGLDPITNMGVAITNQGNLGGSRSSDSSGGGGGFGAVGGNAPNGNTGGNGGAGTSSFDAWIQAVNTGLGANTIGEDIAGVRWIAGGGGGGGVTTGSTGGNGGGGDGTTGATAGQAGSARTGGGGGGAEDANGGAGGSGFVIVRYAA